MQRKQGVTSVSEAAAEWQLVAQIWPLWGGTSIHFELTNGYRPHVSFCPVHPANTNKQDGSAFTFKLHNHLIHGLPVFLRLQHVAVRRHRLSFQCWSGFQVRIQGPQRRRQRYWHGCLNMSHGVASRRRRRQNITDD
jgi:hypothetical protein